MWLKSLLWCLLMLFSLEMIIQAQEQIIEIEKERELLTTRDRFEWVSIHFVESLPSSQSIHFAKRAIESRTTLVLHAEQKWIPFSVKQWRQYPFLHIEMCQPPPTISLKEKLQIRDFFNAGGTLFLDSCTTTNQWNGEWKTWLYSIYSSGAWESLSRNHVMTSSFYLLDMRILLENQLNRIQVLEIDERTIAIFNPSPYLRWQAFSQSKVSALKNDRRSEMRLRFYVNMLMYLLTGNYKKDQLHLPTILMRRR